MNSGDSSLIGRVALGSFSAGRGCGNNGRSTAEANPHHRANHTWNIKVLWSRFGDQRRGGRRVPTLFKNLEATALFHRQGSKKQLLSFFH